MIAERHSRHSYSCEQAESTARVESPPSQYRSPPTAEQSSAQLDEKMSPDSGDALDKSVPLDFYTPPRHSRRSKHTQGTVFNILNRWMNLFIMDKISQPRSLQ